MGLYIRPHRRARLLKYKYSSTDKSLVSKYVLQPYWTWLVTLFPVWMAPNLITLSGLVCVLINFGMLLYFNPTLACGPKPLHISYGGPWDPLFAPAGSVKSGWLNWLPNIGVSTFRNGSPSESGCLPQWVWFTFAVGLFAYQSLDAIDGKQARRTGTSGPLGELFDHGCDALNTTLEVILSAAAMNLGLGWWTIAALVATNANFYLTTWEEYHTGTLYLSEFSGPVEGILLVVGMYIITGFTGPSFWDRGILSVTGLNAIPFVDAYVKDLPLNDLFCVFSAVGLLFNVLSSTKNVYASLPANRSLSSILKPLTRLSPYCLHTAAMIVWLAAPASNILGTTRLLPFMLFWGIAFAHHVGLLILAHLAAAPFPAAWKHPLLFVSVLGAIDANLGRLGGDWKPIVQTGPKEVQTVVWACLGAAVLVYGHFIWDVVGDICEFYDINCLTIKPKQEKKAVSPADAALAKRGGDPDVDTSSSGDDVNGKEDAASTAIKRSGGKATRRKY